MKAQDIKVGKKIIYHPILGDRYGETGVITSEVYEMCGTQCCKIDIVSGVVDIESLEEYED